METGEELMYRTLTFLREIGKNHLGETILVVAHGNLMRTLLHFLHYAEPHKLPASAVDNTGYVKLRFNDNTFEVMETEGIHLQS